MYIHISHGGRLTIHSSNIPLPIKFFPLIGNKRERERERERGKAISMIAFISSLITHHSYNTIRIITYSFIFENKCYLKNK